MVGTLGGLFHTWYWDSQLRVKPGSFVLDCRHFIGPQSDRSSTRGVQVSCTIAKVISAGGRITQSGSKSGRSALFCCVVRDHQEQILPNKTQLRERVQCHHDSFPGPGLFHGSSCLVLVINSLLRDCKRVRDRRPAAHTPVACPYFYQFQLSSFRACNSQVDRKGIRFMVDICIPGHHHGKAPTAGPPCNLNGG